MLDGMSIRQQIIFDPETTRNIGYEDYGEGYVAGKETIKA